MGRAAGSMTAARVRLIARTVTRWRYLVVAFLLALVGAEVLGRAAGLRAPILYEATEYGYRVVPDQDIRRFGRHAFFNAQGMRSPPIAALPAADTVRVLFLGDSVTNGAIHIDQQDTYPNVAERLLRSRFLAIETLNASAPGWATGNELGWLRSHGVFGSRFVVLTISTHDLFQPDAPGSVVGEHPSFPDHRPVLALQEFVVRYVQPYLSQRLDLADPGVGGQRDPDQPARSIANVLSIDDAVRASNAELVVVFLEERMDRGDDTLSKGAKRVFFTSMASQGIPVLTFATRIERFGHETLFFDEVHPNIEGNRLIAEMVSAALGDRIAAAGKAVAASPAGRGKR